MHGKPSSFRKKAILIAIFALITGGMSATALLLLPTERPSECYLNVCNGNYCFGVRMWNHSTWTGTQWKYDCSILESKCRENATASVKFLVFSNCTWLRNECICELK